MNSKVEKALHDWWSLLERMLERHFLTTTDRITFPTLNDRWPEVSECPASKTNVELVGDFLKLRGVDVPYAPAYPLFGMSGRILESKMNREWQAPAI